VKDVDPLVSVTIRNLSQTGFPVWNSFVCSQNLIGLTVQTLKRTKLSGNVDQVPDSYISKTNATDLIAGDWNTKTDTSCFVFRNIHNNYIFLPGTLDQMILIATVSTGSQNTSNNAILFGIFDDERSIGTVEPFAAKIPSTNNFTFTRIESIDNNKNSHSYFSVSKQDHDSVSNSGNGSVATIFTYSPDTYLVMRYTEIRLYTPYDLFAAIGGLLIYVIAIWIFLFGHGKYKAWGAIHRYIFRNSPDAHRKKHSKDIYENSGAIESQTNLVDSSKIIESKGDHYRYVPKNKDPEYYFTNSDVPNLSQIPRVSSGEGRTINEKDIIEKINDMVDEKLWFLEQTLNNHYLSEFRLRKYEIDYNHMKLEPNKKDTEGEFLIKPTAQLTLDYTDYPHSPIKTNISEELKESQSQYSTNIQDEKSKDSSDDADYQLSEKSERSLETQPEELATEEQQTIIVQKVEQPAAVIIPKTLQSEQSTEILQKPKIPKRPTIVTRSESQSTVTTQKSPTRPTIVTRSESQSTATTQKSPTRPTMVTRSESQSTVTTPKSPTLTRHSQTVSSRKSASLETGGARPMGARRYPSTRRSGGSNKDKGTGGNTETRSKTSSISSSSSPVTLTTQAQHDSSFQPTHPYVTTESTSLPTDSQIEHQSTQQTETKKGKHRAILSSDEEE
ncbi:8071_t:CDS:2, partial [Acaulospora morrowiae]